MSNYFLLPHRALDQHVKSVTSANFYGASAIAVAKTHHTTKQPQMHYESVNAPQNSESNKI